MARVIAIQKFAGDAVRAIDALRLSFARLRRWRFVYFCRRGLVVEQRSRNAQISGSIPLAGTMP